MPDTPNTPDTPDTPDTRDTRDTRKPRDDMGRIQSGKVTDTLIAAVEQATEIEATDCLTILYTRREDGSFIVRVICSGEVTVATANWLMDKVKFYLISA